MRNGFDIAGIPVDLLYSGTSLGLVSILKATRLLRLRRFWALFTGKGAGLDCCVLPLWRPQGLHSVLQSFRCYFDLPCCCRTGKGIKLASFVAMVRLFFTIILGCHMIACFW